MMTLTKFVELLNEDLTREYAHMHFYLHAAAVVIGLHREEYQELFLSEAKDEMAHVHEFGKVILGLGGVPTSKVDHFLDHLLDPKSLIQEALFMEQKVVANYVQRMDDAEELEKNGGTDKVHGRWVGIFLEDQIMDSRKTVDHFHEILKK